MRNRVKLFLKFIYGRQYQKTKTIRNFQVMTSHFLKHFLFNTQNKESRDPERLYYLFTDQQILRFTSDSITSCTGSISLRDYIRLHLT